MELKCLLAIWEFQNQLSVSKQGKLQKQKGFSLVETLIGIALLGFLIPMLFFSYANFTGMMLAEREKIRVSHGGSQFLNRFAQELSQTRALSKNSDASNIYFSYYDPIRDEVMKRGYRLAANGTGRKKLFQLVYNETSKTWTEVSPYAYALPEEISLRDHVDLDDSVEFDYCLASDCTVAPERAISVKLAGWEFYRTNSSQASDVQHQLQLPEIQFYLASALTGDVLLSEEPRQLFSFALNDAFGTGADGKMMVLGREGKELSLPRFTAPTGTGVTDVYTMASGYSMAQDALVINPENGRVTWGEKSGSNYAVRTRAGSTQTNLETGTGSGNMAMKLDPASGRVYWGFIDSNCRYSNDGAAAAGVGAGPECENDSMAIDSVNSRLYAPNDTSGESSSLYRFDGAVTTTDTGRDVGKGAIIADGQRNRIFYGIRDADDIAPWTGQFVVNTSGTPSTVLSTGKRPGYLSSILNPSTGTVFFGDYSAAGRFYKWSPGDGTATDILGADEAYPGLHSVAVHYATDRVYFGSGNHFYTWTSGGGLTTIHTTSGAYPGYFSTAVDQNTGRVFFGEYKASGRFYTWLPGDGAPTAIGPTMDYPGAKSTVVDQNTGRVFFGEGSSSGEFNTWLNGILTQIIPSAYFPGYEAVEVDKNTGRVYIGTSMTGSNTNLYTWYNSTLTNIVTGTSAPGGKGLQVDPTSGRVWFDYGTTSERKIAYWSNYATTTSASTVKKANPFGEPITQGTAIKYSADTYAASAQDLQGNLYLVNSTDKTVEKYAYDGSVGRYTKRSSFDWSGYAATVVAAAIDQSTNGITLLAQTAGGQWQIQKYANRDTNGGIAAPTSFSLAAIGSPVIGNPTGMAINNRTGDYLVIDSGVAIDTVKRRLFVVDGTSGGLEQTYLIDVSAANLSTNSVTESNFKVLYNEKDNVLYLTAPTLGNVYALSLSQFT